MVRALLALVAAMIALAACGGDTLQTTAARVPMPTGAQVSFDDIEIDQSAHTVYVADRANSGVDVFDVSGARPAFIKTIQLPAAPNGLAIDPVRGHLYAGTAAGSIAVIDTVSSSIITEIQTKAKEVDLLDFAPGPDYLLASTGSGGTLLTIDGATNKVVATANVGAPIEQPRYEPASGDVYVAVPDRGALTVIEPKTGALKGTIKLGACIPVGMAIRGSTAVIACHNTVIAYDLKSGKQTDLGGVQDGDVVHYFPGVDRFFVTSPHTDVPTLVGMYGGNPISYIGSARLDGGGHAAVYEDRNDTVYTTDPRTKTAGLVGFQMGGTHPTDVVRAALIAGGPLLALLLVVMALWVFLGRHADPINRPQAEPEPRPEPRPRSKLTT